MSLMCTKKAEIVGKTGERFGYQKRKHHPDLKKKCQAGKKRYLDKKESIKQNEKQKYLENPTPENKYQKAKYRENPDWLLVKEHQDTRNGFYMMH